jgi:fumarate hydratase class II
MPLMARNLIESIKLLANVSDVFRTKLIDGMKADEKRCAALIEQSLMMCTTLAPVIGYDNAAALAKQAYSEGKTIRRLATEKKLLSDRKLDELLNPWSMTEPGVKKGVAVSA